MIKGILYMVKPAGMCLFLLLVLSCSRGPKDRRIHISYWEKWTGFEADAMKTIVDDFNASQDRIYVDYMSISGIDRKLLTATAGGNPPDIGGIWSASLPIFAEQWALTPLDDYLVEYGISSTNYIPIFWDMCQYRGHTWALPSTPGSIALIYNKRLFREAGLDPERPPRTIEELNDYARKLTKYDEKGTLVQLGFLPTEPGWYNFSWIYWFGGTIWDGTNTITYDSAAGRKTLEWIQSYTKEYGKEAIQQFSSGFGNFASPQNAFLSGKIAMEIQGVWMYNFIQKYAPGLEWGASPFPAVDGIDPPVVYTEADVLVIPRGAEHPDEAFEFIAFVNSQAEMEKLCIGQRKASPLATVSDAFYREHPHPYLSVFRETTKSPRVFSTPKLSIHPLIVREVNTAIDMLNLYGESPAVAAREIQKKSQQALDRMLKRRERRKSMMDK